MHVFVQEQDQLTGREFGEMIGEGVEGAAAVLAEAEEWRRIMALDAEKVLDVYLDLKSPHAYLAVRPSLRLRPHLWRTFLPSRNPRRS